MSMRQAALLGIFSSLLGTASAVPYDNTTKIDYTTKVVTALTTYCPGPTTITHNDKTYTITSATTLTITDCPCTMTMPHPKPTGDISCEKKCSSDYDACVAENGRRNCVLEFDSCKASCPTKSQPAPKPTGDISCEKKCSSDYDACVAENGRRNCVLEFDSCKASCPTKSQPAPKPTGATMSTFPAPKPTEGSKSCIAKCDQAYDSCVAEKGARNCVMEQDGCKGACGIVPTPVPVNNAGHLGFNMMLAVGAFALL